MDNYPLGSENDPNAPWNKSDFEIPHEVISEVRGYIADVMSSLIYEAMEDCGVLEDDQDTVFDTIYEDARKIWERD